MQEERLKYISSIIKYNVIIILMLINIYNNKC